MYQTNDSAIKREICNSSLIFCTEIAEKVKETPYIPFFEVYTYGLIARYFGLTEKRINNAYKSNKGAFNANCAILTGKEILPYARDSKSLGKSYGHLCEFDNGVVAQIAYSHNMVFNSRALLTFAVILKNESEVAKRIYDILDTYAYKSCGYLNKPMPWFLTNRHQYDAEPAKATAKVDNHPSLVCPYLATMALDDKQRDEKPVKMQRRAGNTGKSKQINQLDENGIVIHKWSSASEASACLGVSTQSIYKCCQGIHKTVGGAAPGLRGKYRFAYAD